MKTYYFFFLAAFLMSVACEKDSPTQATKTFDPSLYQGLYVGTWTNLSTGASGPASMSIELLEDSNEAKLTLDFDGNYLGLNDPPAATLVGTYDNQGAKVEGTDPLFGEMKVTVDANGKIIGLLQNLANGLIPEMTYTGMLTSEKLDADYTIKFSDGSESHSILRLLKQK